MDKETLIPVLQFCSYHHIETSFISSLDEYGLIEIITIEEDQYIDPEEVRRLEKMVRLHYELDINLEGIDVVVNLLKKVEDMQKELTRLKNRLASYED